jgi:hypothetical protein
MAKNMASAMAAMATWGEVFFVGISWDHGKTFRYGNILTMIMEYPVNPVMGLGIY